MAVVRRHKRCYQFLKISEQRIQGLLINPTSSSFWPSTKSNSNTSHYDPIRSQSQPLDLSHKRRSCLGLRSVSVAKRRRTVSQIIVSSAVKGIFRTESYPLDIHPWTSMGRNFQGNLIDLTPSHNKTRKIRGENIRRRNARSHYVTAGTPLNVKNKGIRKRRYHSITGDIFSCAFRNFN